MSKDNALYVKQLPVGPMQNFVYLVGPPDSPDTAVIDVAWDTPAILDAAAKDGRRITHALVTHRHYDHTNGLDDLLKEISVPVVIHPDEAPHVAAHLPASAVRPVHDGAIVQVGSLSIRCIHTPGHTTGSMCFLAKDSLFTGDTLFVHHCGRCDLGGGDPRQMFDSLHRVLGALPAETIVYPGHDYGDVPVSSLARERQQNPYLLRTNVDEFVAFRMGLRRS